MKKTIFATLAAALVLASCAKVEVTEVPDSRAIGFDNFVTNAVKSINDKTLTTFFVYGGWGNTSDAGLVFENQEVTYTALNQECSYTPVKYWVEQTYRFAAYTDNNAALENDNLSFDATLGHMTISNYVADGSADNAEQDLLYAVAQENTNGYHGAEYVAGTATDPVKFDFKHILSQVTFKFTKDATLNGTTITIKNLKVEACTTANFKGADITGTQYERTCWRGYNTMTKNDVDLTGSEISTDEGEYSIRRAFIPQVLNASTVAYNLTFDITFNQPDENGTAGAGESKTLSYEVAINGTEDGNWNPGYSYLYTANITDETLKLNSIKFVVTSVGQWEDDSNVNIVPKAN